ncbi:hypothetical protein EMCG_07787, partial [[Emmonsia] crescens]
LSHCNTYLLNIFICEEILQHLINDEAESSVRDTLSAQHSAAEDVSENYQDYQEADKSEE